MLNRETRAIGCAPTLNTENRFLVGTAAVFYDPQNPGTEYQFEVQRDKGPPITIRERILPGAFDKALREDDVRCLYNHRDSLGRRVANRSGNTLELSVDAHGLNYQCDLPNHSVGVLVREAITRKDLDGSSFGFRIREGGVTYRQEGDVLIRELTDLYLDDVSPVDFPAYRAASAGLRFEIRAEYRSPGEIQQLESLLRPPAPAYDGRDQARLRLLRMRAEAIELRGTDVTSFGSIEQQLYRLLSAANGRDWLWPTAVYDTFCTYETGTPLQLYKQSYTIDECGIVSLTGAPQPVAKKDVYEPC